MTSSSISSNTTEDPSLTPSNSITPPSLLQQGFESIDRDEITEEMKVNDMLKHRTRSVPNDLKSATGSIYIKEDYFVNHNNGKKKKGGRLTKLREPIKKSKSYDGTYSDKAKVGSLKPKRCLHCNSQFINESEDTFCSGECKWSWSSMVYNNQGTTSFSSSNSSLSFYEVNNASLLDD